MISLNRNTLVRFVAPLGVVFLTQFTVGCHSPHTHKQESAARAGEKRVEIRHEKYELSNGLTVILHQDNSDPLVHVDVTYHVGSAREEPGRSGFAHFFEHMMFQGSKHVADEQHFKLVTEAGGNMNGTTNLDRTNYYQTVPSNQLERMLWLESDRMGFLLEAVTQEKFEIQRETVKNERAQRVDNVPYGRRSEIVSEYLYPNGHPYSWPTIGYVEDLDRVNVDDLRAFFARWYGPNNAILTIGGDFDVAQTKAWVETYFAEIPRGPEVQKAKPQPVTLDETRYVTHEDNVHLPLFQLTFPTVYVRHEDEAPLDVLADILGGGKTSLLHKNLVKSGDAVQAVVAHPCRELACEFQIIALANPSVTPDLAAMEEKIRSTLKEFESRGVVADDLQRTKASIESGTVFALQSVSGKVTQLAGSQLFFDEPDLTQADLERYGAVTLDDVMRVYRRYIQDKPAVALSIVPMGSANLAAAEPTGDAFERQFELAQVDTSNIPDTPQSAFDRSVIPPAGSAPVIKTPDIWSFDLDGRIPVKGIVDSETPTVSVSIALEGGVLLEPIEKAGLASLTAAMLNESTIQRSSEVLANELAKMGSSVSITASGRYTVVTLSALSRHLDETLAIASEKLLSPAFKAQEFELLKARSIQVKQQQLNSPRALSDKAQGALLYGTKNRIGLPDDGTISTLTAISLDDVRHFYQQYYTTAKANVLAVGDVTPEQLQKGLGFLTQLPKTDYAIADYLPFPEYNEPTIWLVNKPDAVQSAIRFIRRAMPYDATGEHFYAQLANFPFGGAFNSRINLDLREEKSITYGASSGFIGGVSLGWFEISTDVIQQSTALAISTLLKQLNVFQREGMSEAEMTFMQNAFTQSDALNYETPGNKIRFLRRMLTFNLAPDFKQQQLSLINSISLPQINTVIEKEMAASDLQIIVVGDVEKLQPQLAELELAVKQLDVAQ